MKKAPWYLTKCDLEIGRDVWKQFGDKNVLQYVMIGFVKNNDFRVAWWMQMSLSMVQ